MKRFISPFPEGECSFERGLKTPLGEVFLGESQLKKIIARGREKYIPLIEPTLREPIFIIRDKNGGYLFIKSFESKKKEIYFTGVVVKEIEKKIVVSLHQVKLNKIVNRIFDRGEVLVPTDSFSAVSVFDGEPQHEATLSPRRDILTQNLLKLLEISNRNREISILRLSEVLEDNQSFRIDSEYFKREYLKNIKLIKNYSNGFIRFNEIIKRITGGATPLGANYYNKGVLFLRVQNIMQNYFNLNDVVYISEKDDDDIKRSRLKINDILLTITGISYGKSAVVTKKLVGANINQHSVKIEVKNSFNPLFISTFLNSKIGKLQSDKNIVGISRPALDYQTIKKFYIPLLPDTFQTQIEKLVKTAHQKLETSKTLYKEAENLLLKELDLLDFQPSNKNISIKSFSKSFGTTGRLDAEYYQPKYDEILEKIKSRNFSYIKHEFIQVKDKFDKTKQGYNYIEIGDINISDGTYKSNYVLTEELPANAKVKVKKGDLLISKVRPNRGAIAIIDKNDRDLVVSGAFTVLRKTETSKINIQTMQILLKSKIYKELLLKYNVGTQYPVIKDEDILNLEIPLIDQTIQTQIEEKIKESFRLKKESKELLELAKRAVEVAIEEGEERGFEVVGAGELF